MVVKKVRAGIPVAAQLVGVGVALVGLHLLVGLAVTLLVGGVLVAAAGAAREAGRI